MFLPGRCLTRDRVPPGLTRQYVPRGSNFQQLAPLLPSNYKTLECHWRPIKSNRTLKIPSTTTPS
jgi:hypothetical protein